MEGWTLAGPSLLPAQPNPQRSDEGGQKEEETEWEDDGYESSPGGFLQHKWKQHLAEEKTSEQKYFRTHLSLSFI